MSRHVSNPRGRDGWQWEVRCYYGPGAKPPRREGDLAIGTCHRTDSSKYIEVRAAEQRADIGHIEVLRCPY